MNVFIVPQKYHWPQSGGVREHMRLIDKYATQDKEVNIVASPEEADLYHVESAYRISPNWPKKPTVYVCHGGFVPKPLPTVLYNLHKADQVVSVARWVVYKHFPQYINKTIVIPNGIDLPEYDNVQPIDNLPLNSVLYGKDYVYNPTKFVQAMFNMRDVYFLSIVPMPLSPIQSFYNFKTFGKQEKPMMNRIIKSSGCLMMTGSEVCPIMVLEAWACGVPVVAFGIDGNHEIMWSEREKRWLGGLGYSGNPTSVIRHVLAHREELGAEGRKIIEIKYSMQKVWDRFKDTYRNLLDTGRPVNDFQEI